MLGALVESEWGWGMESLGRLKLFAVLSSLLLLVAACGDLGQLASEGKRKKDNFGLFEKSHKRTATRAKMQMVASVRKLGLQGVLVEWMPARRTAPMATSLACPQPQIMIVLAARATDPSTRELSA